VVSALIFTVARRIRAEGGPGDESAIPDFDPGDRAGRLYAAIEACWKT